MKFYFLFSYLSVIILFSCTACKKGSNSEGWEDVVPGSYVFTTIYHMDDGSGHYTDDTLVYTGTISLINKPEVKIVYEAVPTSIFSPLYTYLSDDGAMQVNNLGSHSSFTGTFDLDGNIGFQIQSYGSSWHVSGFKIPSE